VVEDLEIEGIREVEPIPVDEADGIGAHIQRFGGVGAEDGRGTSVWVTRASATTDIVGFPESCMSRARNCTIVKCSNGLAYINEIDHHTAVGLGFRV
jgi:hypothetical protein